MRLVATKADETSGWKKNKKQNVVLPASLAGREEGTGGRRGRKQDSVQGGKMWSEFSITNLSVLPEALQASVNGIFAMTGKSKPPGP